ncbi:MAG: hypothetical protein GXY92_05500 [Syntrophomonadaceae bacterium]|nr:hypothetical protein [Syntrophomonadaceae bacterium]
MSKIIKPHEIILEEPIYLELPEIDIKVEELLPEIEPVDAEAEAKAEVEVYARDEAERIVKETEEMVVEILEKAGIEARNVIGEAEEEAREIRLAAEKDAALLRKQAEEEGYKSGWNRAMEEAQQRLEQARQQSEELIEQARKERLSILGSCERIIVRMALDIAEKIVEQELITNPDIITELVHNIIDSMNTAETYKVLVNPEDYVNLAAEIAKKKLSSTGNDNIQLAADNSISRGGCVVETDLGVVDARLETRIASLREALMDVVES